MKEALLIRVPRSIDGRAEHNQMNQEQLGK